MVSVRVEDGRLLVALSGWDRVLALRAGLAVPLERVVEARWEPSARPGAPLAFPFRLGTYWPGRVAAGLFWTKQGLHFYDVRSGDKAVVIDLQGDRLRRIVVEVEDPVSTADAINAAIRAR